MGGSSEFSTNQFYPETPLQPIFCNCCSPYGDREVAFDEIAISDRPHVLTRLFEQTSTEKKEQYNSYFLNKLFDHEKVMSQIIYLNLGR